MLMLMIMKFDTDKRQVHRIFTCPKKGERSSLGRNAINLLLVVGNDTQVYQCVRSIRFDEFGEGDR